MEPSSPEPNSFSDIQNADTVIVSQPRRTFGSEERPITSTGRNHWTFIDWENENESSENNYRNAEGNGREQNFASMNFPFGTSENHFLSLLMNANAEEEAKQGLPKEMVERVRRMKMGRSGQDCSVCYNGFNKGEKIRRLPCKHIFHDSCILPWLDTHVSCPNCRFNLLEFFSENPDPDY